MRQGYRRGLTSALLLGLSLLTIPPGAAQDARGVCWNLSALWESKYVSEGRNNLDDGGMVSYEVCAEWSSFNLGVWYALGDSENYQELNLYAGYTFELGPFEGCVSYTRLEFPEDDAHDNELGLGWAWFILDQISIGADYYYSTEADGGFLEWSLRGALDLFEGRLAMEPYILEGFDFGYASDEYDGPNHLQVGLDVSFALTDAIELTGYLAHSWAHEDVKRAGLGDLTWGGFGISAQF